MPWILNKSRDSVRDKILNSGNSPVYPSSARDIKSKSFVADTSLFYPSSITNPTQPHSSFRQSRPIKYSLKKEENNDSPDDVFMIKKSTDNNIKLVNKNIPSNTPIELRNSCKEIIQTNNTNNCPSINPNKPSSSNPGNRQKQFATDSKVYTHRMSDSFFKRSTSGDFVKVENDLDTGSGKKLKKSNFESFMIARNDDNEALNNYSLIEQGSGSGGFRQRESFKDNEDVIKRNKSLFVPKALKTSEVAMGNTALDMNPYKQRSSKGITIKHLQSYSLKKSSNSQQGT